MDLKQTIRTFVSSNFYIADPASWDDDTSLLETGIVDSTGVLEIIAFLENDCGVTVDDSEIAPENLDSVSRIAAFISRKKAA
jgi:acyl carrier protein